MFKKATSEVEFVVQCVLFNTNFLHYIIIATSYCISINLFITLCGCYLIAIHTCKPK